MSSDLLPPFSTIKRKTPVKRVRAKARPNRKKGKAMEQLRRECFERDHYLCQGTIWTEWPDVISGGWFRAGWPCGKPVTWESGHMAHIGAKRRHGDNLENVRTLCAECHMREHSYGKSGVKPCPPKQRIEEN
jgi:5-methylcytosine-specific restriction endonuclease McrA